jgi:hypothetical protein
MLDSPDVEAARFPPSSPEPPSPGVLFLALRALALPLPASAVLDSRAARGDLAAWRVASL